GPGGEDVDALAVDPVVAGAGNAARRDAQGDALDEAGGAPLGRVVGEEPRRPGTIAPKRGHAHRPPLSDAILWTCEPIDGSQGTATALSSSPTSSARARWLTAAPFAGRSRWPATGVITAW